MNILKTIAGLIPAGLGMLGRMVGVSNTDVRVQHIGPAHQYNQFGACQRCNRFDKACQLYTQPPCPRIYDKELP